MKLPNKKGKFDIYGGKFARRNFPTRKVRHTLSLVALNRIINK